VSLSGEIDRILSHRGDQIAVQDRERALRFFDVREQIDSLASNLARLRPSAGGVVTIHVPKSVDEYVVTLALMYSGLPGLTIAPDVSIRQIETIRELYPVALHLVHREFTDLYRGCVELERTGSLVVFAGNAELGLAPLPTNCAWTLLTSGSTGAPKLVMIDESNLLERARGEVRDFGLRDGDSIACFLNSSHDLGLNQILSAFFAGAKLMMHKLIFMIDFVRLLAEREVAGFTAVPSFWHLMIGARVLPLQLPQLRYVTVSGGGIDAKTWDWLRQALPHVDIIRTYGQTETFRSLLRHGDPADGAEYVDSIGFPLDGVQLTLSESGELRHRGAGTMLGYYGASPVAPEQGVATGDVFTFDPVLGYRFQGRRDEMLKINGHRVYPTELERVFMEHPSVREVMVSVVSAAAGSIEDGGVAVDLLFAVVALENQQSVSSSTLQNFVATRVPRGLVPNHVIVRERLPKTSSGKIDRVQIAREVQSFLFRKTKV